MQGLEIAARQPVRRWEHELAHDRQRTLCGRGGVDQLCGSASRIGQAGERPADPGEAQSAESVHVIVPDVAPHRRHPT